MQARVLLITVGIVGLTLPLTAATIQVTTTDPTVAADGQCSLIEAIVNANDDAATHADCPAGSGVDTIELASSALYELDEVRVNNAGPNGLPTIRSAIAINGHDSTIQRAAGALPFRFFHVNSIGDLTLNDVTLKGGDSGSYLGGALNNQSGMVALHRTTVTGNTAQGAGGIYNRSGTMTLTDCVVSLNTGTAGVGGILSEADTGDASLVVERSHIRDNQATGGSGGGVYSLGDGSYQAELRISGSEITNNTATYNSGGVRSGDSVVVIEDSTISGNHAGYFCAGGFVVGGAGDIDRTTFSGNVVDNTVDFGTGGGLCVSDNTTTISNSTFSGNQVLGPSTGAGLSGRGGGISLVGGAFGDTPTVDTVVIVEDSTISDNTAETTGGGISVYRFAGTMAVELELRNTIVADNHEGGGAVLGNCVEESPAMVTSLDFNLADDVTCNLVGTDDLVVPDAMLGPLAHNGGPTMTHLPQAGSPAIDSGDDGLCPAVDQRGAHRPEDGDGDGQARCDRGAVELGVFSDGFESGDATAWSHAMP